MKKTAAVCLLLVMLCGTALAQEPSPAQTQTPAAPAPTQITAVGTAPVVCGADYALLTLRVCAESAQASAAQAQAQVLLEGMAAAVREAGAAALSQPVWDFKTRYRYHYGKLDAGDIPTGYEASASVEVRVNDLSLLGAVLEAAFAAGAQGDYSLLSGSTQQAEAYRQALALAAEDAVRQAELLAQSCGLSLDRLLSVTECPQEDGQARVELCYAAQ